MQFARLEDAKAAQSLNGQLDIAGRVIKVTLINMYCVGSETALIHTSCPSDNSYYFNQVSAVTDQGGMQLGGTTTGDLDDDEGGGLVRFLF